jgi:hypothetical protein
VKVKARRFLMEASSISNYRKIIYTADDEEPKCGRCDHFSGDFDCCGSCGAKHGWYGYTRTKLEKIELGGHYFKIK